MVQEFQAEFITQPLNNPGELATTPRITWSPEQSPSSSSVSSINTLPSSMDTIEPRPSDSNEDCKRTQGAGGQQKVTTSPPQPELLDIFNEAQPGAGQLTTLPFQTQEFSGHDHCHCSRHQDSNCSKFEADIEILNCVRRTILATPQPM